MWECMCAMVTSGGVVCVKVFCCELRRLWRPVVVFGDQ
jgi:hypothetical protein